ncbi:phage major capsid E family protein [Serratia ureilytica]|uniref:major capsid protein n=1 Tax=Serratia TaxID=613 RepID=UPI000627BBCF|nr:major capsid protein [Serratia ureilytica]KKO57999.1 phage major capsid E family protein [Serratia ureilytica]MBN5179831.1 major capsid protein [Serratia marcescens]
MSKAYDFDNQDMSASFEQPAMENHLLQEMKVFGSDTSTTPKASVDYKLDEQSKLFETNERYGTDYNTTEVNRAKSFTLDIPHITATGRVTAKDFQGKRVFGSKDATEQMAALVAAEAFRQHKSFLRTKEKMLADALFYNRVSDKHTGDVDFTQVFGFNQQTHQIDATVAAVPIESMKTAVKDIKRAAAGRQINRMVAVCGSEFMNTIKYHPLTIQMGYYKTAPAVFIDGKEISQGYEIFELDGVTYIESNNPDYEVEDKGAFLFPVFKHDTRLGASPFMNIAGPASRDAVLADSNVIREFYAYSVQDKLHNVEVFSEASMLPVIYRPDFVSKLTLK